MAKQEYRSAVRSREFIRSAFLELLEEKPYEKITVTDIVKRADINRSTFYAHYPDVCGLVDHIVEETLDQMTVLMDTVDYRSLFQQPEAFLRQLAVPLMENCQMFRLLLQTGQAGVQLDKLKERLVSVSKQYMNLTEDMPDYVFFEIRIRFSIGGMVDVCVQWLRGELDCTIDEIVAHLAGILVRSSRDAEVQRLLT